MLSNRYSIAKEHDQSWNKVTDKNATITQHPAKCEIFKSININIMYLYSKKSL